MKVISAFPYLLGSLVASGVLISPAVWAGTSHEVLVAQQVVDGLPPPPPGVVGQESLPTQSSAPQMGASNSPYLVIVNGDSPLLLSQVQTLVANASIQEYNGQRFILAGTFNDAMQAQQQVSALASQGIGAEVVTMSVSQAVSAAAPAQTAAPQAALPGLPPPDLLPATPVPREIEFGQPAAEPPPSSPAPTQNLEPTPSSGSSYYVVIPGSGDNLESIMNQVIRLGDGVGIAQMVQTSDSPGGPHVRIGPFVDRGAANRWNRYLRDFGMGARVYYQR